MRSLLAVRPVLGFVAVAFAISLSSGAAEAAQQRSLSAEQRTRLRALPAIGHLSVDQQGILTFVEGRLGYIGFGPVDRAVHSYMPTLLPLFRGKGHERFRVLRVERDEDGFAHLRMEQESFGLPIVGAELVVHVKERTGEVTGVNGRFVPTDWLPSSPGLDGGGALAIAIAEAALPTAQILEKPALTYVIDDDDGEPRLTWAARVAYRDEQGYQEDRIFADAVSGHLVAKHGLLWRAKYRKIYNAGNTVTLPGTLMFQEGGSSADLDASKAYEYSGNAYDYFSSRHSRDSWNGSGGDIISSVHYGNNHNDAFWNGNQLAFGDGNGTQYTGLARALDVVAHELTHGVTQSTANLTYANESGALNEAMSDIFGSATEAYVRGESASTWKIAEDVFTPGTSGDALRYMSNPTQDGDSKDYYPERYLGSADNGGVHWNSGIANLAFYLLSEGGSHPRGKTSVVVPSVGNVAAEKIFYKALQTYMTSSTNFSGARDKTLQASSVLYGPCSSQTAAVDKAWEAVGVPRASAVGDFEPNDTLQQANTLPSVSNYLVGYLCTSGNADWYVINKSSPSAALTVMMDPPLSADYDLELWQVSQIWGSYNSGNGVDESIIWNQGTGNFYVKVVGKSGAFSTASSYSLSVSY
jgi:Zn-dependent metalloprotease